jgi:DNA-3-methyladenine glycosylase
VYFIYGMYFCVNITTEAGEKPGAVLIRAGEPLKGIEKMKERRGVEKVEDLCSGPGKLCMALGITKEQNGLELGKEVSVWDDGFVVGKIGKGRRVGIKGDEHLLWRFFVKNLE